MPSRSLVKAIFPMEPADPVGLGLRCTADGLAGTTDGLTVELGMLAATDVAGELEGLASFEGAADVQPASQRGDEDREDGHPGPQDP